MLSRLKDLKNGLSHLFFPHLCEGCRQPLVPPEKVLCIGCSMELPETGYHNIADNETALRLAGRIPYQYATSYAYFTNDGLLQHLLHGLKYGNKKEIGIFLGRKLGQALQKTDWISTVDAIIPVPLHKVKQAKRGYNQSLLIAEGMNRVLKINIFDNKLLRTRDTESQTHKTRTERVNNMADAFRVKDHAGLANKHLLLVDDVLTTGATLEACALALLRQGGTRISIATLGVAVS